MMFIPVSHQKPTAYHSSHKLMGKFLEQLKVKGKRKKKRKKSNMCCLNHPQIGG